MGRRTLIALAVVAAIAGAAGAGPAAGKDPVSDVVNALAADAGGAWAALSSYELVRVDGRTGRVTHREDVGPGYVVDLAVGEGGVWGVGRCGRVRCRYGTLARFDPATGRRSRPITRLGASPRGVAASEGWVWVLGGRRVLRIDPGTRRLAGPPIPVGRNARDIAVGAGAVWVTTAPRRGRAGPVEGPCSLVGIDPRSGTVIRRQPLPCSPDALAVGAGMIWATAPPGARGLVRVEPRGARTALPGVRLPGVSAALATGGGRVWVAGVEVTGSTPYGALRGRAVLTPVNAQRGRSATAIPLGVSWVAMLHVAAGSSGVWVANAPTGTLRRIDASSGRLLATVRLRRSGR